MDEIRTEVECVIDVCTICLNEYKENETKQTTKCTHIFHEECLIKLLSTNNSCPLCRTELKTKQENIINNIDTSEDTYNTDNINIVREFLGDDPILARGVFGNFRDHIAIDNYLTSNVPINTTETFSYNVRAHTNF
jgi:predicted membrane protein